MASRADDHRQSPAVPWSTVLGALSAGLGLAPVLASGPTARTIGLGGSGPDRLITATVGVRELAAAAGLLSFPRRWMLWGRVAGDAVDLGLLAGAVRSKRSSRPSRTLAAAAAVAAVTAVDVYAAAYGSRVEKEVFITSATTLSSSPDDAYRAWRRLEDLPRFMAHVDAVQETGPGTSHWRATAPFGRTIEWDAEIVDEVPGRSLAWRSTGGAPVRHEGRVEVRPAPAGSGTELRVTLRYRGAGPLARAVARYFGEDPRQHLDDDLRRFKQVVETGEVLRSDGALGGKHARREFPQRPARPPTAEELAEELAWGLS